MIEGARLFLGVEIVHKIVIQERGERGVWNLTVGIVHKFMVQERM